MLELCVSVLVPSAGLLGVVGDTDRGERRGESALPRAQRWCGRDLGSSGTWWVLEFYCVPARAWHSHESECGRTERRTDGQRDGRMDGAKQHREKQAGVGGCYVGDGRTAECCSVVDNPAQQEGRFRPG